ncbi:MAG: DUF4238 domain-containing protein [Oscillospiraceae bacterium]|nr:DUF4238 domain-containing protein [Oscillospiraceae bacterium]
MSEEFRKQHIVSQAYLRRFALCKGGKYIIGTRLKPSGKRNIQMFSNSVSNVGYIENYYDTLAQTDKKFWEHYLDENFDILCDTPLSNIISGITLTTPGKAAISQADKMILAKIVMSQMIRVPFYLDKQIDMSAAFLDSCKKELVETLPFGMQEKARLIKSVDFDADSRKNMILESIFDKSRFDMFCNVLVNRVWIIYYNVISQVMPFVTSDNPVLIKSTTSKRIGLGVNGIDNDSTVILYPLTPSIMLGIYSPNMYFGVIQRYDRQKEILDDIKFISKFNIEIIDSCYKHAFLPSPLYKELQPNDRRYDQ